MEWAKNALLRMTQFDHNRGGFVVGKVSSLKHSKNVMSVVFSPDGKFLVSTTDDNMIHLWEIASGQLHLSLVGHSAWICDLQISPNGKLLASFADDETIRIWDTDSGHCIQILQRKGFSCMDIEGLAFQPGGKQLAANLSRKRPIQLLDALTGSIISSHPNNEWPYYKVLYGANVLASLAENNTIKLCDILNGNCLHTLSGHTAKITGIVFSPNEKLLISGSNDSTMRVWNTESGDCLETLYNEEEQPGSMVFSPNGQTLACVFNRTVRFLNVTSIKSINITGGQQWIGALKEHDITCMCFSLNGRLLVTGAGSLTGSDFAVRLWNVDTGHCIQTMLGHTGGVRDVSISPDGLCVASVSMDRQVRLWDAKTGNCIKILTAMEWKYFKLYFSLDNQFFAELVDNNIVDLWKLYFGENAEKLLSTYNASATFGSKIRKVFENILTRFHERS